MGWTPAAFSEIEPFPSAVLAHHYPTVPNMGDMTKYKEWDIGAIDLLVGGTPCQSFSVAGLRKGLADPRGNLALVYLGIADLFKPKWIVWENVPGVLSSAGGRDFGSFLGALAQLGYGFAYRVLDAQWFGVAQRRKRVFVVGYLGDWRPAAAVLFERQSLSGHPKPSREKGEEIANCLTKSPSSHSGANPARGEGNCILQPVGVPEVMATLLSSTAGVSRTGNAVTEHETYIPMVGCIGGQHPNAATDTERSPTLTNAMGSGGGHVPLVNQPIPLNTMTMQGRPSDDGRMGSGIGNAGDPCPTITKAHSHAVAQPIACDTYNGTIQGDVCTTMTADMAGPTHSGPKVMQHMAVRRLTPVECERLQGFPDNYTEIPWRGKETPDGPRYKSLGNSMAVPVMKWIGERIALLPTRE
jgi:DNA (cytosine-5)-methyltransferase 1